MQAVKRASHWLSEVLASDLPAAGASDQQVRNDHAPTAATATAGSRSRAGSGLDRAIDALFLQDLRRAATR